MISVGLNKHIPHLGLTRETLVQGREEFGFLDRSHCAGSSTESTMSARIISRLRMMDEVEGIRIDKIRGQGGEMTDKK